MVKIEECFRKLTITSTANQKNSGKEKRFLQYLPMDLVSEILVRLPVKSIIRFRCVCKSWQRLLKEDDFRRLHYRGITRRHGYHNHVALCQRKGGSDTFSAIDSSGRVSQVSLAFLKDSVTVQGSSNGILCCSSTLYQGVFYLCNPMTQEFRQLPRAAAFQGTMDIEVALACDPSTWTYYVIVIVVSWDRPFISQMFCSRTNTWEDIVFPFEHRERLTYAHNTNPVFVNGKLHFLTNQLALIALDVTAGTWSRIQLPGECVHRTSSCYPLEMNGSLSLFYEQDPKFLVQYVYSYKENSWFTVRKVPQHDRFPGSIPVAQFGSLTLAWRCNKFLAFQKGWKIVMQIKHHTGRSVPRIYGYWSTLFPLFQ